MKETKAALILAALKEFGPMTRLEIEEELGVEPGGLRHMAKALLRPQASQKNRQRVHICRWARADGSFDWRPVYKLGHGVNQPMPAKAPRSETNARYWAKRKAKLAGASVFRLGSPREWMRNEWKAAA